MSERGARSRAGIDPAHLDALNAGTASSRTLAEALAIDQAQLLRSAVPGADASLLAEVDTALALGIAKRMAGIGHALARSSDAATVAHLAAHPSDTVRGWMCFLVVAQAGDGPEEVLGAIRRFADDEHFAVREWAWMAARPVLVARLDESIAALAGWAADPSERVRRFASEALRPRGVWSAHIDELKQDPARGEPILHPLRADPSRYVQDSVANWINDAAKSRPDWALDLAARWTHESDSPATARIVKRGLRSVPAGAARA